MGAVTQLLGEAGTVAEAALTEVRAALTAGDDQAEVNDFVTAVQSGQKAAAAAKQASAALAGIARTDAAVTDANRAIASISTQVEARFGSAQASIIAEAVTRADGDSALSASITSLTSTVNGNTASISSEALTRATQVGAIQANYTVNVDANGHIAGIQLLSEEVGGTPSSEFNIRADKFRVILPGYSAKSVFEIAAINGTPTISIRGQVIQDASIGNNTILTNAVSNSAGQNASGGSAGVSLNVRAGARVAIIGLLTQPVNGAANLGIWVDGALVTSTPVTQIVDYYGVARPYATGLIWSYTASATGVVNIGFGRTMAPTYGNVSLIAFELSK